MLLVAEALFPTLFVSHGSPMVALDAEEAYGRALRRFATDLPTPRAIVVISAHWQAPLPVRVTDAPRPSLLYDFGGFPDELYRLTYPCPGAPELAQEIFTMLRAAGVKTALDGRRGLDHGAWVPLRLAFPDAKVPVVAVSLPLGGTPEALFALGRALAPLRQHGVLLLGSGGVVHNLSLVRFDDKRAPAESWAVEFDRWVRDRLEAGGDASGGSPDADMLLAYRAAAPHARRAVPTTEHFDPLFVVLGARADGERIVDVFEGFQHGTLSMRCFAFAQPTAARAPRATATA